MSAGRPAIFLDRDGVLNELVIDIESGHGESPLRVSDVQLTRGAAAAVVALRAAGFALVCVTNQPGAAKGQASVSTLEAIQRTVGELLAAQGAHLDAWRMCLHHPDGVVGELAVPCDCRKPAPGMLSDAARELELDLSGSWMVGDTDADVAAGRAAGSRTVLIENPSSAHKRAAESGCDLLAADIRDAARQLLALEDPRGLGC